MGSSDHIRLADGRRLDVQVSGPTDGVPLVFHHGTPGAATPVRALERAAHARGLRLVTTSRPGYGGSTRQPGRAVVDVVADTIDVLRALVAERCLVAGWSGGGPHALACAARLPGAAAALVISGVAPYGAAGLEWAAGMGEDNVVEFGAALEGEGRLRPYLIEQREQLKHVTPDGIVASLETLLPDVDRAVLTGEFAEDVAASFHAGLRLGVDGWVDDDLAFTRPWGFDLAEVTVPHRPLARLGRPDGPLSPRPMVVVSGPGRDRPPRDGRGPLVGRAGRPRADARRAVSAARES